MSVNRLVCARCPNPAMNKMPCLYLCRECYDRIEAMSARLHGGKSPSDRPRPSPRLTSPVPPARRSSSKED